MSNVIEVQKIITPIFRVAFANVFRPKGVASDPNSKPKFSVMMLFDKDADLTALKAVAMAAAQKKWGANAATMLKHPKFKSPFKDQGSIVNQQGDLYGGFVAGNVCIQCSSEAQPDLIGPDRAPIMDERQFYSGCYAIASVKPYAWSHATGGNGVSFDLHNIMKVRDGEPLTAVRTSAEEDFANVEVPAGASAASAFD